MLELSAFWISPLYGAFVAQKSISSVIYWGECRELYPVLRIFNGMAKRHELIEKYYSRIKETMSDGSARFAPSAIQIRVAQDIGREIERLV